MTHSTPRPIRTKPIDRKAFAVRRRLAATAIDYVCLGLVVVIVAAAFWLGLGGVDVTSPTSGQLLGLATVTVPGVALLAVAEVKGGSPGKRIGRLRVAVNRSGPRDVWRVAGRTVAKYAVPWELAHAAVWRLVFDDVSLGTWILLAGAYALPIAAGVAVLVGRRPWFDVPFATNVLPREDL